MFQTTDDALHEIYVSGDSFLFKFLYINRKKYKFYSNFLFIIKKDFSLHTIRSFC